MLCRSFLVSFLCCALSLSTGPSAMRSPCCIDHSDPLAIPKIMCRVCNPIYDDGSYVRDVLFGLPSSVSSPSLSTSQDMTSSGPTHPALARLPEEAPQ